MRLGTDQVFHLGFFKRATTRLIRLGFFGCLGLGTLGGFGTFGRLLNFKVLIFVILGSLMILLSSLGGLGTFGVFGGRLNLKILIFLILGSLMIRLGTFGVGKAFVTGGMTWVGTVTFGTLTGSGSGEGCDGSAGTKMVYATSVSELKELGLRFQGL